MISTSVVWAVSQFNDVLDEFVVLAALMPLVARIGGDAGAQSLAVVIRGLAADEIPMAGTSRVVIREATIGAINGVAIAVLAGILGFVMQELRGGSEPAPDRAVDGDRRPGQPGDSRSRRFRDPAGPEKARLRPCPRVEPVPDHRDRPDGLRRLPGGSDASPSLGSCPTVQEAGRTS